MALQEGESLVDKLCQTFTKHDVDNFFTLLFPEEAAALDELGVTNRCCRRSVAPRPCILERLLNGSRLGLQLGGPTCLIRMFYASLFFPWLPWVCPTWQYQSTEATTKK